MCIKETVRAYSGYICNIMKRTDYTANSHILILTSIGAHDLCDPFDFSHPCPMGVTPQT